VQTGTTVDISPRLAEATAVSTFAPLAIVSKTHVYFLHKGTNVCQYDVVAQTAKKLAASTGRPALTPDGRYLALQWAFANRGINRVSRLDTTSGIEDVVANPAAAPGFSFSLTHWLLSISDDGRFIAFVDPSGRLNPSDTNGVSDVYVADLWYPGLVTLASVNRAGTAAGNGASDDPALSANGRFLTFRSAASNLVPGDNNGVPDIFVRDLRLGITYLASVAATTLASANSRSAEPQISANGAYVAFTSFASDLVVGDNNPMNDVFSYRIAQDGGGDADRDGLPDNWELAGFGTLAPTATDDNDGDGADNLAELQVGTVPTLATSVFRLRAESTANGSTLRLRWPAVVGRAFGVQYKESLGDTVWQTIPAFPGAANPGELELGDPLNPPRPQRCYRVVGGLGEP
jgi:hypothetical protein